LKVTLSVPTCTATRSVLVVLKGGDVELAKDIAMHVAASNPEFLLPSEVSADAIEREKPCSCS
jgi:translation elongation factor EF-Ts